MKRIVKTRDRVIELFVNVRKKSLRAVEYGRWYVATDCIFLEKDDLSSLLKDTDHDIMPIILQMRGKFIHRRNPYFSSKTGRPLSKWFTI